LPAGGFFDGAVVSCLGFVLSLAAGVDRFGIALSETVVIV